MQQKQTLLEKIQKRRLGKILFKKLIVNNLKEEKKSKNHVKAPLLSSC